MSQAQQGWDQAAEQFEQASLRALAWEHAARAWEFAHDAEAWGWQNERARQCLEEAQLASAAAQEGDEAAAEMHKEQAGFALEACEEQA